VGPKKGRAPGDARGPQQVTHEGVKAPAQVQGKTPRSLTRKQRNRAAKEHSTRCRGGVVGLADGGRDGGWAATGANGGVR
jgi:hypothetical protein